MLLDFNPVLPLVDGQHPRAMWFRRDKTELNKSEMGGCGGDGGGGTRFSDDRFEFSRGSILLKIHKFDSGDPLK